MLAIEDLKPALRFIFSAGGPLSVGVSEEFRRTLGFVPTEIYGSTETGAIAWRRQPCDGLWTVLPQVEVKQGNEGCIRVRSSFLADRNWLALGDRIQLGQENRFELLGRNDRFVKIEERLLSLPDMEARLRESSWLLDAAVTTIDLVQSRRAIIAAAIILNDRGRDELRRQGPRGFAKLLRQHLAQWFEPILLPRRWRFPEKFPINELGKLPADALQRLFLDGAE
jgi:acyl-coenzyme A synthetase/AMP-(fatty) acid ligase